MAKKPRPKNEFEGRWRVTWMDQWDQDYVDEEVEGYIEFDPEGLGSFQFGYVQGQIDYRKTTRDGKPAIEFSWEGGEVSAGVETLVGAQTSSLINMTNYQIEPKLTADEFIDVLVRSTLAERRPVDDRDAIRGVLTNADIILTARCDGRLVGVSRAITDRAYCTYLSDLAVDRDFQRQGIGRQLIQRTHEAAGLNTTLILLSAPKAATYYAHIGMTKHESCWVIPQPM